MQLDFIKHKIYEIRGLQVMLDSDLAELYDIKTMVLNQAVKRNIERFPKEFMFQLTEKEFEIMRSQIVTTNKDLNNSTLQSQFVIANSNYAKRRFLPYAFTEQGVAMLSGVLRSKIAIQTSIQIMQAFVAMRHFLIENKSLFSRVNLLEIKQLEHDNKIEEIFDTIATHNITPTQGVFFDGQIWDAYILINNLLKTAKHEITLFDNYINEDVLTLFSKYNKKVTIYTRTISKQLALDIKKYNEQHNVTVKDNKKVHDRFLIIDNKHIYHLGASLKDLGKKVFAFTKLHKEHLLEQLL